MQTSQTYQTDQHQRGRNLFVMAILLTIAALLSIWLFHRIWPPAVPASTPVATVAVASTFKPCTAISDECGDVTIWRKWTDVDRAALTSGAASVLDCAHVFKRIDIGAGYNMDGATHTQIAVWFGLSKADRIAFFNDCKKD